MQFIHDKNLRYLHQVFLKKLPLFCAFIVQSSRGDKLPVNKVQTDLGDRTTGVHDDRLLPPFHEAEDGFVETEHLGPASRMGRHIA